MQARIHLLWKESIYPWLVLAWKEFWLPFRYFKTGCPGGRDFAWLTVFMTLMLTLMLLLFGSREGLLNRFVDVFLGKVSGYGVPIAVTNNMLSQGGIHAIDTEVLEAVTLLGNPDDSRNLPEIPGLQIHPHRTLEASLRPFVSLPDEKIWKNRLPNGSKFGPDFDGWAVYQKNPLWPSEPAKNTVDFPLQVVVSRALFDKYFDYEIYRQTLQQKLPSKLFKRLPAELDMGRDTPLKEVWLQVTLGMRRELLPFQVKWVQRFPVIDPVAYAFPLTTYHALNAAFDFPELRYFPEFNGQGGDRVGQLLVRKEGKSSSADVTRYEDFVTQLRGETRKYHGDLLVTFPYPLPKFWISAYAEEFHINYRIVRSVAGDKITHDDCRLNIPCRCLPPDKLREFKSDEEFDRSATVVPLDVTSGGNGFQHALVYIPDRTFLSKAAQILTTLKGQALAIHPSYQDALNRFGFLSKILEALERPYSWFLAAFLVALLGIQIATLIGHHRHRYGVFLAKGMEWWQIYAMLWFQIFIALIIGLILAWGGINIAATSVQSAIIQVAEQYAETLSIAELNLLPLTAGDYLLASGIVLLLSWGLALILLYFMPLRQRTHPASLLH